MAYLDDLASSMLEHADFEGRTIRPRFYVEVGGIQYNCVDPGNLIESFRRQGLSTKAFRNRANSYRHGIGPEAGRGYVLLLRSQLTAIGSSDVTLVIEEVNANGERLASMQFENLTIDRAEAVNPGYDPAIISDSKATGESVYLVHLVDIRREKQEIAVDRSYNLLFGNNVEVGYLKPDLSFWTVKEILDDLAGEIGWNLTYANDSDPLLSHIPEGFRFLGVSCYDALWTVLRAFNYRLSLTSGGTPWVIPATLGDTSVIDDAVTSLNRRRLLNHKGFDHPIRLPNEVRVYFPNRDFQFHLYGGSGGTENPIVYTPEEVMHLYPFYRYDYTVTEGTTTPEIHHLWGTIPRTTDDQGNNNEATLDSHADALAANHVQSLQQWDTWKEFTYTGCVVYEPIGPFSGAAWYDFGGGLHTKLFQIPVDYKPQVSLYEFSPEDFVETLKEPIELAEEEPYPTSPDVTRKHPVIPRLMPGVCTAVPEVQVNEEGDFAIYFGIVQAGQVSWNQWQIPIKAFPFFSKMSNGDRCLLKYNWQLGSGGEWIAIGFEAGTSQQHPAAFARARPTSAFECSSPTVQIGSITYMSPDPNSLPWPGPPDTVNNLFGLSGTTSSDLLLMYDRTAPATPVIAQVSHTCETVLRNGIFYDPDVSNCIVSFPTYKVNAPLQDPFVNVSDSLSFVYKELVKRVYWDNDKCTLYYQSDPVCVLNANWIGTPPAAEGTIVYDLRDIRSSCLPCDPCPCDCASFDSTIKMTWTAIDTKPSECVPPPGVNCQGNCTDPAGPFCVEWDLDETTPDDPDVVGTACDEPGPPFATRVWKGTAMCANSTGDPPGFLVILSCDPVSDPPLMTVCIKGTDGKIFDESPLTIIDQDDCGCLVALADYDLGGDIVDFCGCTLDATCEFWIWFNLLPSKGGYFCENRIVVPPA